jgi:hypothetical protein
MLVVSQCIGNPRRPELPVSRKTFPTIEVPPSRCLRPAIISRNSFANCGI